MTIKCFSVHATDATSEISKEEASDHDTVNSINTITAFYQEFGLSIRRWSASSLGVPSSSTGATVAVAEPSGPSIPSSDDESDEGSVLQLVVSPVPPTKTGSESLQSSESSAKPPAASEPLVASDSPVRKSPASTHDQGPDHNFVDDVESDAESTSTLVFALGDEAKANTPTDSAVLPSVARGSSVETTSVAVDDSPPASLNWLSYSRVLDTAESLCTEWVDSLVQRPYNTTFAPCNHGIPLIVPAGPIRESFGRQIQVNPLLTNNDLARGWDAKFRVPPAAPGAAPAPADGPAPDTGESSVVDDADFLRFFARVMSRKKLLTYLRCKLFLCRVGLFL
ncbi:hypothetical protein PC114_g17616 [Phytophthora cactorum]|uniref:Uncharacterized protein n=1 Tax=Phytophthora cactorum TaxID=29920 RepID=A0A8T1BFP1_9STRA|nr:hypothetical protein PC114_g17616 [Phytophthora cactorum]KAG2902746.1 hypothetical protein PC115_g15504 [Phytophthora cactorum]KAG3052887.1 hypothetical protein PC121_g17086 [Phytophthora cactorum]